MRRKDRTRTKRENRSELDKVLSKAFKQSFASITVFASEKTFMNYFIAVVLGVCLGASIDYLSRFLVCMMFCAYFLLFSLISLLFRGDRRRLEELENMFNEKGEKHA